MEDLTNFAISAELHKRAHARGDAWVYTINKGTGFWGLFVDEEIKYKTLFTPGSEVHSELDEFIIPLLGKYWVKAGDVARTIGPGECAIIPRDCPHDSGIATNLVGTRFLVILFDKSLGVLKGVEPGVVRLPMGSTSWLRGAFRFLRQSVSVDSFLPLSILPEFLKRASLCERLPSDQTHPDSLVQKMVSLLENAEPPPLEKLAAEVNLSPTHLQKRFVQVMGVSPLQYANAWKLDQIANQIKKGSSLAITELAAEFGFNDPKHFRALFLRRFACTPSAYRKNPPSA